MLTGNRISSVAIVLVDNFQVALKISLVEQTAPDVEIGANCFSNFVRQLIRIAQRPDQVTDLNEHIQSILSSSLFINVLDHNDHAGQFAGLISKRNTEHTRPNLLSVFGGIKHLATGAYRFTSHR